MREEKKTKEKKLRKNHILIKDTP